jgi:hypothetical protein
MAVLSAPSATVINEYAIAALTTLVETWVILAWRMIDNIVSCAHHLARGGRQHSDVVFKPTCVRQAKVCALMAIID